MTQLIAIGAGIAVLTGIGAGIGIGLATSKAVDAIARHHIFKPHARNQKLLDAVLCPEQRADQIRTDHRDPR